MQSGIKKVVARDRSICVVEKLTIVNWLFKILPALMKENESSRRHECLLLDGHPLTHLFAKITGRLTNVSVESLDYDILDVRTRQGISARLLVGYGEMAAVQHEITRGAVFDDFAAFLRQEGRADLYVTKKLCEYYPNGFNSQNSIWSLLIIMLVSRWQVDNKGGGGCILYANRRPWHKVLASYAAEHDIQLRPLYLLDFSKYAILKSVKESIAGRLLLQLRDRRNHKRTNRKKSGAKPPPLSAPMLAIEYYSPFAIDKPECNSDLFFWPESEIPASSILLLYNYSTSAGTEAFNEKLKAHNLKSVGYSDHNPVGWFQKNGKRESVKKIRSKRHNRRRRESRWLSRNYIEYRNKREKWDRIFTENNIRVFTHWYKYDWEHIAMTDALRQLGGIMTLYQRSYEELPSPRTCLSADVLFSFSQMTSEVERQNGSAVKYQVITGYLGDHRFALLEKEAQRIRSRLKDHGARTIYAFFDENSGSDKRWFPGHNFTKMNYEFLLERLLGNEWMGLVIKPKVPRTLRQRLGKTAETLERAIRTGRCHLCEEGYLQGTYPPSLAALASDLAVHEFMSSGTAGMESALCGTPTLMLDSEGWPLSKFYALGRDEVVFSDLESAWTAMQDYHLTNKTNSSLGDWSDIIEAIDPFRDGQAAKRMGRYLHDLIGGMQAGRDRTTVMAEAARKYAHRWGADKVIYGIGDSNGENWSKRKTG